MTTKLIKDTEYIEWFRQIKAKIQSSQIKAAIKVNTELISLYWELGQMISEKQKTAIWGEGIINQLSKDLSSEFPEIKGFSRTNLLYINKWYQFYNQGVTNLPQLVGQIEKSVKLSHLIIDTDKGKIIPQLVGLIPWGHNREIITKCKDIKEAIFYVVETLRNNWSRAVLLNQMESGLYMRKGKTINNFELTLPKEQSDLARETFKDPYKFDFLTLGSEAQERDLEDALVNHLTKFLLELGAGFAYLGRQYHLEVGGQDYYIDLLFYHIKLKCFVAIELKVGEFKPEYAGKINFYLSAIDSQVKGKDDKPSIGIILCKTNNKVVAEYALRDLSKPIGIAEYKLTESLPDNLKGSLPTIEEIERELKED